MTGLLWGLETQSLLSTKCDNTLYTNILIEYRLEILNYLTFDNNYYSIKGSRGLPVNPFSTMVRVHLHQLSLLIILPYHGRSLPVKSFFFFSTLHTLCAVKQICSPISKFYLLFSLLLSFVIWRKSIAILPIYLNIVISQFLAVAQWTLGPLKLSDNIGEVLVNTITKA